MCPRRWKPCSGFSPLELPRGTIADTTSALQGIASDEEGRALASPATPCEVLHRATTQEFTEHDVLGYPSEKMGVANHLASDSNAVSVAGASWDAV